MVVSKANKGWDGVLALCKQLKTSDEFEQLFDLILTLDEKADIATRYLIIEALLEGEQTQREMAKSLGVSIAKITRGSNSMKTVDAKFKKKLKALVLR